MPTTRSPRLRDFIPAVKSKGTIATIRALFQTYDYDLAAVGATALNNIAAILNGPGALQRVLVTSGSNYALDASNYWTFTIKDVAGNTWATWTNQTGAITANVPAEFTLTATDHEFTADKTVLLLNATRTGSAAAFTGRVQVEIDPILA